ncbi:MAG TPA: biotin/lipoyl-containing protein, partial [Polyangiales bacterium]|nr:biotin/lipoyl-containing protein [Polyangiales bacterium]
MHTVVAPMQGLVARLAVREGDVVKKGQALVILEAMKMEHVVAADCAGMVRSIVVRAGETVSKGERLLQLEQTKAKDEATSPVGEHDDRESRADLEALRARLAIGSDENRPEAVARRRKTGRRTARENLADLVDPGTFVEYGALVIAAQRQRRSVQELIAKTPADGLVAGMGDVNGASFPDAETRT